MAQHAAGPHIVPTRIYYTIFATLVILTGVTVGVAYIDLGRMNVVAAIAIACFKATIVALYFMHVKYSTRLVKLTVIAGLYWMAILFSLTFSDYLTRAWGTFSQQITLR